MKQLRTGVTTGGGQRSEYGQRSEHGQRRYLTAICLAWEPSSRMAAAGAEQGDGVQDACRRLAEWGLAHFYRFAPDAANMQYRWLGEDLFLFAVLETGDQHPQRELLSQVRDVVQEWEEHAARALGAVGALLQGSALRFGVGAVPCETGEYGMDQMYEAAKRAIVCAYRVQDPGQSPKGRAFRSLLTGKLIYPVYQPIVALPDGSLFGYEALTRLPGESGFDGPLDLFRFAGEIGEAYRLDRLARELAINGCARLPQNQKLFINVMAQIMEDPQFSPGRTLGLLEEHHISPLQVVFEINERSSIEDYPAMQKALQHYRSQGYQIAIDDVGAGYSSLQSIVELRPDYIKVDRSIIQDIHSDEVKAHIVHTLQEAGSKIGAALIAEGIERSEELDKLKEIGVRYAQGYLLGRPAPFPNQRQ